MNLNQEQLSWLESKRVAIPPQDIQDLSESFNQQFVETKNTFKDLCSGKRVLIVGNSNGMITKSHREEIDSYDIVVRLSAAPLRPEYYDYFGTKTTLWALGSTNIGTLSQNEDFFKSDFFGHIYGRRSRGHPPARFTRKVKGRVFLMETPESRIEFILRSRIPVPSTGAAAINFFVEEISNIDSLSLIGFDFFKCKGKNKSDRAKSFYEHRGIWRNHNGNVEKYYAESLQEQGRLKILKFGSHE